jgi:ABC-type antimicrobial peptide transport system permease subunit
VQEVSDAFERELLRRLRPEQVGLVFQPVKAQGLEASKGGTDFGQLFLAFSFFLIVSAAILIALVFRLGVERRAKQIGLLLAVGFDRSRVSRFLIAEGLIVAGVGCLVGLAGAIGYAWLVMAGLRTWWLPAVGTSLLRLHVPLITLGIGVVAGLVLAAVAIVASARGLTRLSPRALLGGAATDPMGRPTRAARRLHSSFAMGCVALAAVVGLVPAAVLVTDSAVLFFLVGTSLLISALSFLTSYLTGDGRRPVRGQGAIAVARLGARNAGRHRGRSVLTASLVACATFVIMAVGANRTDEPNLSHGTHAASGGLSLVAESDVPLLHDLNSPAGRLELGIPDSASDAFNNVRVFPFRVKEGEDASCLNLYQPKRPRVLGAPSTMIGRGGFRVQRSLAETAEERENPWRVLDKNLGENVIPAIGDANSVRWILKLGLGQRLSITAEDGHDVDLQIVAMLDKSIFQSELVISDSNFRRLFPSQAGYSYFLIEEKAEGGAGKAEGGERRAEGQRGSSLVTDHSSLAAILEQNLGDFGFDATPVSERLAEYHAVENTYLSTFQMLGGLGLVLGTLGLGAVLLRSVVERRGELALLLAVGFRPALLVWMVLAETGFLLIVGLGAGAVSALVAVAPHIVARAAELPWASLVGTLGMVLAAATDSPVARAAIRIESHTEFQKITPDDRFP